MREIFPLHRTLSETDLLNVDVHMEGIDQSGNEEVNISSVIANLFKQ